MLRLPVGRQNLSHVFSSMYDSFEQALPLSYPAEIHSLVTGKAGGVDFLFYNWHLGANEVYLDANSSNNVMVCQLFSHLNYIP